MTAKTMRQNLVAIAAAYGRATGESLEVISKNFYGNRTFLRAFKAGKRSMSIDKFDQVVASFRARWPDGAEWPHTRAAIIRRPDRKKFIPRSLAA